MARIGRRIVRINPRHRVRLRTIAAAGADLRRRRGRHHERGRRRQFPAKLFSDRFGPARRAGQHVGDFAGVRSPKVHWTTGKIFLFEPDEASSS